MLEFFLSYLLIYKYVVLFLVVSIASVGIPMPATALLMATGAFAAQGYMDLRYIFVFGFLASVLGDLLGYYVSILYGRNVFVYIGLKWLLVSPKFALVEKTFVRHSVSVILLSRFLTTSLGPAINILSGISRIPFKKFLFYDLIGEGIYVCIFVGLGYIFWNQWEVISSISGDIANIVALVVGLFIIVMIIRHIKNEKKSSVS